MSRLLRSPLAWLLAAAATAAAVLLLTGGDGQDADQGSPVATGGRAQREHTTSTPSHHHRHRSKRSHEGTDRAAVHEAVASSPAPQLDPGQRQVARVARAYVAALDAGDGARACELFVPGALADIRFPRRRGGCARSLSASIGYRDPRGFPVYRHSRIARIPSATISEDGADARVVATVVTRFAGNREPSVEDDLVYLRRVGDRWLIVKPSASLYRAIGVGDIPPQVLSPP